MAGPRKPGRCGFTRRSIECACGEWTGWSVSRRGRLSRSAVPGFDPTGWSSSAMPSGPTGSITATRSDPGVGFIHFGDGPLRATVARRIAELGLEGRFILAGFRSDIDRFVPHWDLSVLPSFTEGLPNVVLEAFAAGVPVVATAVGGTPEIVEDGFNGYLVPPGDPEALARRIRDSLLSEEERRSMGQRGRERVLSEFTFEAKCKQYQQVWADLIDPRVAT